MKTESFLQRRINYYYVQKNYEMTAVLLILRKLDYVLDPPNDQNIDESLGTTKDTRYIST